MKVVNGTGRSARIARLGTSAADVGAAATENNYRASSRVEPRRRRDIALLAATTIGVLVLLAVAGCSGSVSRAAEPAVTIAAAPEQDAGGAVVFLVRAEPAPSADLTIRVSVAADGCELKTSPESATIAAGESQAMLPVQTIAGQDATDACTVTVTIVPGEGYRVDDSGGSASISPTAGAEPEEPALPFVTIAAESEEVVEGTDVSFTLTATPEPDTALTVRVSWSEVGSFLADTLPQTVTIPELGTATLRAETVDDGADEPDGSVTVTVGEGDGYMAGTDGSATVTVKDNDEPASTTGSGTPPIPDTPPMNDPPPMTNVVSTISVAAGTEVTEGEPAIFTFSAAPPPAAALTVSVTVTGGDTFLTGTRPTAVEFPATVSTVALSIATDNDTAAESHDDVTVTIETGNAQYDIGVAQAELLIKDNEISRQFTYDSGTLISWEDGTDLPNDGQKTRMHLNNGHIGDRYEFKVLRGGAPECTMALDPSANPGAGNTTIPAGSVRMRTPQNSSFETYSGVQSLTFDSSGDRVELSDGNGDKIIVDVSVSC